jgi:hypothetical protein
MPDYAAGAMVVLDFLPAIGIIKVRGELDEKTWFYP